MIHDELINKYGHNVLKNGTDIIVAFLDEELRDNEKNTWLGRIITKDRPLSADEYFINGKSYRIKFWVSYFDNFAYHDIKPVSKDVVDELNHYEIDLLSFYNDFTEGDPEPIITVFNTAIEYNRCKLGKTSDISYTIDAYQMLSVKPHETVDNLEMTHTLTTDYLPNIATNQIISHRHVFYKILKVDDINLQNLFTKLTLQILGNTNNEL